ncbi:MAG: pitrilysin family protein, partial [Mangrovibacterium sp.]|nr:pitrilysin family protein [Mangrovibacterium sp.]
MVRFFRHQLANGLQVLIYPDHSTPMAAIDVCYHVGSKNEDPERTGFAHLFEHLMFGGSIHIPDYDLPLQQAGGENNAYTTNDRTNYYLTVPRENVEIGFWLESDRMLELAFSQESLHVQRNVVIEEFKQRNLNQPYGDVWSLVRELAYQVHPYRWPTIGKDISHLTGASLDDVKSFFYRYYAPDNAVLVLSG